jgi:hypothetical protein
LNPNPNVPVPIPQAVREDPLADHSLLTGQRHCGWTLVDPPGCDHLVSDEGAFVQPPTVRLSLVTGPTDGALGMAGSPNGQAPNRSHLDQGSLTIELFQYF